MDFGSQHVYDYACSDDEVIAEDDFSNPLYASDDEDDYDLPAPPPPPPPVSLAETDYLANIAAPPTGRSVSPPAERRRSSRSSRFAALNQATDSGNLAELQTPQTQPALIIPSFIPQRRKKHVTWDIEERALSAVPPSTSKIHKIRKADTNVLSINFRTLKEPSDVFTGEAELCTNCRSVFSHLSVLTCSGEDSDKIWRCEYCGHENIVDLMPEEIPKDNDVTYMLLPPTTSDNTKTSGNQSLLIFCIDISGSMAATTEIPGSYQLKEDPSLEELLKEIGLTRQEYQVQVTHMRPAVTYLSRLKSLQSAVQSQLDQLTTTDPDKRVAIITFNNEVIFSNIIL
ncbi:Circularly permutated Ras protein 1-like [Oopsacas minuta]|uniref:Circularly permutated Ras protein 1-like n=1 Tax=Oopsacas minuta TaxID=111878 RepID=A0AAV7K1P6_9METZ|nr:Circularly permutated Ras protein 1-like [Oopsacas minuta]